ncbi:hypothetical protein Bca52824_084135 [Brassica carinata]|uniref:Uncharacterized protein n=1 Tax=Brassica carinata TaxID=52824 RepID=A0A8X7PKA4_BRACI|nr:hypothetical protein Bca52824_084135 [Brassica carinata]
METEKAFLKQPKVFLSWKKLGKGKRPGKSGNPFWKNNASTRGQSTDRKSGRRQGRRRGRLLRQRRPDRARGNDDSSKGGPERGDGDNFKRGPGKGNGENVEHPAKQV